MGGGAVEGLRGWGTCGGGWGFEGWGGAVGVAPTRRSAPPAWQACNYTEAAHHLNLVRDPMRQMAMDSALREGRR